MEEIFQNIGNNHVRTTLNNVLGALRAGNIENAISSAGSLGITIHEDMLISDIHRAFEMRFESPTETGDDSEYFQEPLKEAA